MTQPTITLTTILQYHCNNWRVLLIFVIFYVVTCFFFFFWTEWFIPSQHTMQLLPQLCVFFVLVLRSVTLVLYIWSFSDNCRQSVLFTVCKVCVVRLHFWNNLLNVTERRFSVQFYMLLSFHFIIVIFTKDIYNF